ncbi:MAG: PQQ-binding-like beta-propeller repeat protein [Lacipirellulaceae bacterium]
MKSLAIFFVLFASSASANEPYWPEFRGPTGQGIAADESTPLTWSETENVRFKTAIPGRGWSSPVVLGNHIWMTTAVETPGDPTELQEAAKQHKSIGSDLELSGRLSLRAVCVDRQTGELLHNVELIEVAQPKAIHSLNSYASPTPVIEPGRLYCHFGRYGTVCLNTEDLSILWKKAFEIEHFVGPGSSPVVCDDLLILTCDGADKQFIVAVDKLSGEIAWNVDRPPIRDQEPDFRKSYCTPLVIDHHGKKQIVITGAQWFVSYAPKDGSEIWRVDHGHGFSVVPRPVADEQTIYCPSGFTGKGIFAIRTDGQGDVTDSHVLWKNQRKAPTQSSPLLHNDRIYTVTDMGVAQCLSAETGEPLWSKRLGGGYSASPLLVGDAIYFFSREGETTVFSTENKPKVLARNQLDGQHMASPAVAEGELIVRTDTHLYAIHEVKAGQTEKAAIPQ